MANNPPPPSQTSAPPRHSKLLRIIAIVLLVLIVLVGLAVLIIWLVIKPRNLKYSIEDGSIKGFNLTDNHLNSNFSFVLRGHNPNGKVSIYYDKIEVSVLYDDQTVAFDTVEPFFQPHGNVTRLGLNLVAKDASLVKTAAKDLSLEKSSGEVEWEVKMKAKIRFKVGSWKLRRRTMRVTCEPVLVHFSSSKAFERTTCDVDL